MSLQWAADWIRISLLRAEWHHRVIPTRVTSPLRSVASSDVIVGVIIDVRRHAAARALSANQVFTYLITYLGLLKPTVLTKQGSIATTDSTGWDEQVRCHNTVYYITVTLLTNKQILFKYLELVSSQLQLLLILRKFDGGLKKRKRVSFYRNVALFTSGLKLTNNSTIVGWDYCE